MVLKFTLFNMNKLGQIGQRISSYRTMVPVFLRNVSKRVSDG